MLNLIIQSIKSKETANNLHFNQCLQGLIVTDRSVQLVYTLTVEYCMSNSEKKSIEFHVYQQVTAAKKHSRGTAAWKMQISYAILL